MSQYGPGTANVGWEAVDPFRGNHSSDTNHPDQPINKQWKSVNYTLGADTWAQGVRVKPSQDSGPLRTAKNTPTVTRGNTVDLVMCIITARTTVGH